MRIAAGLRARWPAVRASAIALVIALGLVEGCPIPEPNHTPPWAQGARDALADARRAVLSPVDWIGRDLDITQRWALFRGAATKRFRLYVEGRTESGAWQLLYRAGDSDHDAYGPLLDYRRVRGTYNPSGQNSRAQYHPFAGWFLRRVLADHPAFLAARTRMERIEISSDGVTATGSFALDHQELRRLR